MSRRVYKNEEVSAEETHRRLRDSYTDCIASYLDRHPEAVQQGDLKRILDIGCSVGCSTRAVADRWPQAQVTGDESGNGGTRR